MFCPSNWLITRTAKQLALTLTAEWQLHHHSISKKPDNVMYYSTQGLRHAHV